MHSRLVIVPCMLSVLHSCSQQVNPLAPVRSTDTLSSGGYSLMFQPTDSFPNTNHYGDDAVRHRLTDTIGNWHDRAKRIENYLKPIYGAYFRTSDTSLDLTLEHGKIVSYPIWDEARDEGFNFEYYFKEIDYYVLRVQWGEGNCWMMVNRKTGYQKYLSGQPFLSPDNTKILAINSDLYAGYSFNGIALYLVSGDTLATEFETETNWGPEDVKWLSSNQFLLKCAQFQIDSISGVSANKIDYRMVTFVKRK